MQPNYENSLKKESKGRITNMKKFGILFSILIFTQLFAAEISQKLERPEKVFIGSPVHLHVEIQTLETDSVFTAKIDTIDIFQVLDISQTENFDKDTESMYHKIDIKFAGFDAGKFDFPELEFTVKRKNDNQILKTKAFNIEIISVIADSSQVIKEIHDPIKIHFGFWEYFIPIISLIILIALIFFLRKFIKSRKKEILKQDYIDTRPAYQKAMEQVEALKAKDLLSKGSFIEFHFQLSLILRFFIEEQFKINAMEMTTNEIRQSFHSDVYQEKNKILDYLAYADKVKFAKFSTTINDSESYLKWFINYLKLYEKKYFEMKNKEGKNV